MSQGISYVNSSAEWFDASSPVLFRTTTMLSFTHIIFIAFQRFFSSLFPFRFRAALPDRGCELWFARVQESIVKGEVNIFFRRKEYQLRYLYVAAV